MSGEEKIAGHIRKVLSSLSGMINAKLTRRQFLSGCVKAGVLCGSSMWALEGFSRYKAYAAIGEKRGMREAMYYEKMGDEAVKCLLCPNNCVLSNGQRGFCRVREPLGGKLYTLVYELACAVHVDPIEKKPFYHFLPGSKSFSIATAGCNSRCKFCQNWTISQSSPEEVASRRLTCDQVVEGAIGNGCSAIAYTYSEPTVFYEYMLDTAKRARKRGVRNIVVTGGKISPDPLKELCGSVEAVNIDLKGMDPTYLSDVCAQDLDDILKTILIYKREGVWVELTNLIVPTMNDNMEDIKRMASWVVENAGPDVPMHFSRFWPQYKLRSLYPTPVETLLEAREVAIKAGLHYVYVGNVPGSGSESTSCPSCSKTVIKRIGYRVTENNVRPDGTCSFCSGRIAGVWV